MFDWIRSFFTAVPSKQPVKQPRHLTNFKTLMGSGYYMKHIAYSEKVGRNVRRAYALKTKVSQKKELEKFMNFMNRKDIVFIAIDFEGYEQNPNTMTEVGIAIYTPSKQKGLMMPFIESKHIIISDTEHLRNGMYVPDHKDSFNGEASLVMNQSEVGNAIHELIEHYSGRGFPVGTGVCIVCHGIDNDEKWLRSLGIDLKGVSATIDTQKILAWTHGKKGLSLRNSLDLVRQPYAFLHNAGNDAYYTMVLCLCLADPLYRQACGMDDKQNVTWFRNQPSTKNKPYNVAEKFSSSDLIGDPKRF